MKTYLFTVDQLNEIMKVLGECPLKLSLPAVDLIRKIVAEQDKAAGLADEVS